jgi:hypothetical protein
MTKNRPNKLATITDTSVVGKATPLQSAETKLALPQAELYLDAQ